jgi:hypothetical protein
MTTRRVTTALLVLLLALVSAPAAAHATPRTGEPVSPQAGPTQLAPVEPVPGEPSGTVPVQAGPQDPAPEEAAPDDPTPAETAPSETAPPDPPAEGTPPATAPAEPAPNTPQSAEPLIVVPKPRAKRRHHLERPPELPAEELAAPLADNSTRTVQVIVQVQVGCRHHCVGTSQTQTAIQDARTDQTAVAPDGTARNHSVIEQYVWQLQLGCVAFCSGTVQTQTVEQRAQTTQTAMGAETANVARTVQVTHQRQRGRRGRARTLLAGLDALLRDLAGETGATIQVIRQIQVADCLHHCTGDTQVQLAVQHAVTAQTAAARTVEGID